MTKNELLGRLPAGLMREAHRIQSKTFVLESVLTWESVGPATRADILAFFESDGPAKVADARRRLDRQ